jgi:hypothetical protein
VKHGLMGPGTSLGGATPTYGIYAAADGYIALHSADSHEGQAAFLGKRTPEFTGR